MTTTDQQQGGSEMSITRSPRGTFLKSTHQIQRGTSLLWSPKPVFLWRSVFVPSLLNSSFSTEIWDVNCFWQSLNTFQIFTGIISKAVNLVINVFKLSIALLNRTHELVPESNPTHKFANFAEIHYKEYYHQYTDMSV